MEPVTPSDLTKENENIAWSCVCVDGKAPFGNPEIGFGVSCYGLQEQHKRIVQALNAKDAVFKKELAALRDEIKTHDPLVTKTYPDGTSETHPISRVVQLQEMELKTLRQERDALRAENRRLDLHKKDEKSVQRNMADRQNLLEVKLSLLRQERDAYREALANFRYCLHYGHRIEEPCGAFCRWVKEAQEALTTYPKNGGTNAT